MDYKGWNEDSHGLGRYDWYCSLADDIGIADRLFFTKLAWFQGWAGADSVLQPNRFETSDVEPVNLLYIDGEPVKPDHIGYLPHPSARNVSSSVAAPPQVLRGFDELVSSNRLWRDLTASLFRGAWRSSLSPSVRIPIVRPAREHPGGVQAPTPVRLRPTIDAVRQGIAVIHQEL